MVKSPNPDGAERACTGGRVGLIRNPYSRRNLRRGTRVDPPPGQVLLAEPDTLEGIGEALADFARREVGLVVVDGGDGAVREVLSALPTAYPNGLPRVSVLASGTTNLIAADVGAGRSDPDAVRRLADIARVGPPPEVIQRRSTLEVSWPDGSRPPVHGMFLGAAAFTRATDISVGLVRQGRIDEGAGVAATLISALGQVLAGPERERWMRGEPMSVAPEGAEGSSGPRFLFLASTLQRLVLGLWPFWGAPQDAAGVIRYLDVAAPPKRLVTALPAVMRGRPRPWMEGAGYRSGAAATVELALREPFIIDGEVFEAGPGGRIRLAAGPQLEFVVP